jgi:hypothetical protein
VNSLGKYETRGHEKCLESEIYVEKYEKQSLRDTLELFHRSDLVVSDCLRCVRRAEDSTRVTLASFLLDVYKFKVVLHLSWGALPFHV